MSGTPGARSHLAKMLDISGNIRAGSVQRRGSGPGAGPHLFQAATSPGLATTSA